MAKQWKHYDFFPWSSSDDEPEDKEPKQPSTAAASSTAAAASTDAASSAAPSTSSVKADAVIHDQVKWDSFVEVGIRISVPQRPVIAWRVLEHLDNEMRKFRKSIGETVCIFKIGISAIPLKRWELYQSRNYKFFTIIYCNSNLGVIEMCEAYLIKCYGCIVGCRNVAKGGEGACESRSYPPPYFLYLAGARADGKPVGS